MAKSVETEVVEIEELEIGVARLKLRKGLDTYDRQFIPSYDEAFVADDHQLQMLALAAKHDLPALLVGPTGCGKSSVVQTLGALLDAPVRRINFHGDVRASDVLGEKTLSVDPSTGQTIVEWRDGPLPDAMRRGHWVILDELDACPASIAMTLQSILETGHMLTLAANHGELIKPHPEFRVFATANTLGRGDSSGLYAGTNMLNEATLDRFVVMNCGYPVEGVESKVLSDKTGISREVATRMVQVANLVRSGVSKNEAFCTFSTRRLLAWALLTRQLVVGKVAAPLALEQAYYIAVQNKLGKEDAEYVGGIVQRTLGFRPKTAS